MLSFAQPGWVLPNKEDPNQEPPLDFTVPVDLRKGSGDEGDYPCLALVDLSTTCNYISQAVADWLSLEAAKKKQQLPIATVKSKPLRTTAIIRQMVPMWKSAIVEQSHAINFIVADITNYIVSLGIA
jgi:hypothetical protein